MAAKQKERTMIEIAVDDDVTWQADEALFEAELALLRAQANLLLVSLEHGHSLPVLNLEQVDGSLEPAK
jgi:hypothetical protein